MRINALAGAVMLGASSLMLAHAATAQDKMDAEVPAPVTMPTPEPTATPAPVPPGEPAPIPDPEPSPEPVPEPAPTPTG